MEDNSLNPIYIFLSFHMYFIFSCLQSILFHFNLIYEKFIYANSQLITSIVLSRVLTSLRVLVHPIVCFTGNIFSTWLAVIRP